MSDTEFFEFLKTRQGRLEGVAITGGEPLIHEDIWDFIKEIRKLGFKIKLDTNGYHPDRLEHLYKEELLDYVAMDIKNSLKEYRMTVGKNNMDSDRIIDSISLIMHSGIPYEFRTTVVKGLHKDQDFIDIGKMAAGAERYFLQQFTERDTVPDKTLSSPSVEDMMRYLNIIRKYVPSAELRGVQASKNGSN